MPKAHHSCARLPVGVQKTACPTFADTICRASVSDARGFQKWSRGDSTQTGRPEAERAGANESNALQFISALTALCDR